MSKHPFCPRCGRRMQRHGQTLAGTERYRCSLCGRTTIIHRPDTHLRHERDWFVSWLTGAATLTATAERHGLSRQALSKAFQSLFREVPEPAIPPRLTIRVLIVDGTYVHGDELCALIAVTEEDLIFWRFAPRETYRAWCAFFARFPVPTVVVADGHKGIRAAVETLWPTAAFQRCHFHVVSQGIHYLTRKPKDETGQALLALLHRLKEVKTPEERDRWRLLYRIWERQYAKVLSERTASGRYAAPRLRGARLMVRRALPHLFTYLDYPGTPNTVNLIEGWVNTAIAEGLRRHRGLRLSQKKTLVSVILSHLTREKPTRKFT